MTLTADGQKIKEKDVKKDLKFLCMYVVELRTRAKKAGMKDHFLWRDPNTSKTGKFIRDLSDWVRDLSLGEITKELFFRHSVLKGETSREPRFPFDSEEQIDKMKNRINEIEEDFKQKDCDRRGFPPCCDEKAEDLISDFPSLDGDQELTEKLYFVAGAFSIFEEKTESPATDMQFDIKVDL